MQKKITQSSQATRLISSPCRNRETEAKQCRDVEAMHVPCKNHARPGTQIYPNRSIQNATL